MQLAVVVDADDVTGDGVFHQYALVGHEGQRVGQFHLAIHAHVLDLHTGAVATRADAEESDAVAMLGIHVGLDLEDEASERRFGRLHQAFTAVAFLRRRRPVKQRLQDFLDTEVIDPRAEEDRRLLAGKEINEVEGAARTADQVNVVAQFADFKRELLIENGVVDTVDLLGDSAPLFAGREAQQAVAAEVIDAAEGLAHADRPGNRRAFDTKHRLDFLKQLERLAHFTV